MPRALARLATQAWRGSGGRGECERLRWPLGSSELPKAPAYLLRGTQCRYARRGISFRAGVDAGNGYRRGPVPRGIGKNGAGCVGNPLTLINGQNATDE